MRPPLPTRTVQTAGKKKTARPQSRAVLQKPVDQSEVDAGAHFDKGVISAADVAGAAQINPARSGIKFERVVHIILNACEYMRAQWATRVRPPAPVITRTRSPSEKLSRAVAS